MPRTHKSLPRLYLDAPLAAGQRIGLEREHTNYLLTVLRMKAGEAVIVFNGRDGAWLTRIAERFPALDDDVRLARRALAESLPSRTFATLGPALHRIEATLTGR